MSASRPGSRLGLVAVVLVAIVVGLVSSRGEEPYRLKIALDNANGLRKGSGVRIAGVEAGRVAELEIGRGDKVVADLEINPDEAPVGRDVAVSISSINLLGQKFVELEKGDVSDPAPSGSVIAPERIGRSTDLDQLLGVLDGDTRARLAVLVNEAGTAFAGRRQDFTHLLGELPQTFSELRELVRRVSADTETLGELVERSDRFVTRMAAERRELGATLDEVGDMSAALGTRRPQLREALRRAPGTMQQLQRFLADLRATTEPLSPAAKELASVAPTLQKTLSEVRPFQRAAEPLFAKAEDVAPALTKLSKEATPVLRQAVPTAQALQDFSDSWTPAAKTVDKSIDNTIAILENWARVMTYRDGLSHVFRAEAVLTPEALNAMVDRLTRRQSPTKRKKPAPERAPAPKPAPPTTSDDRPAPPKKLEDLPATLEELGKEIEKLPGKVEQLPEQLREQLPKAVDDLPTDVGKALGGLDGRRSKGSEQQPDVNPLLDFLLGR